jgi:glycine cleavage system H protein
MRMGIRFSERHHWVRVEGDQAIIGITEFLAAQLEEVSRIKLPRKGAQIVQDEVYGELESTGESYDLVAPISGKVERRNDEVLSDLSLLCSEPMEDGWLLRVKLEDRSELSSLMTRKQYDDFLEEESAEMEEDYLDLDEDFE